MPMLPEINAVHRLPAGTEINDKTGPCVVALFPHPDGEAYSYAHLDPEGGIVKKLQYIFDLRNQSSPNTPVGVIRGDIKGKVEDLYAQAPKHITNPLTRSYGGR